jgi:carbon-monoxide dehydrogenase large subunit
MVRRPGVPGRSTPGDVSAHAKEGNVAISRELEPADGIGASTLRSEDLALLTGRRPYTGDLHFDGLLQAKFVRSTMAHARLRSIDTDEAAGFPGVVAIFTAADLDLKPTALSPLRASAPDDWVRPLLAVDTVRFVGEMLAVVVADTAAHATDAAEAVFVDYEPIDAVIGFDRALNPAAPPLFSALETNEVVIVPFEGGERRAEGTVKATTTILNHRMAVVPMETNAVVAIPEPDGRITVWASTQFPHWLRDYIATTTRLQPESLHVMCTAVGGGFGGKGPVEPEYAIVTAAAHRLGRPIQFVQSRNENLTTMQGRAHRFMVGLEATADGEFTDLAVEMHSDAGAYPGAGAGMTMTTRGLAAGPYRIPHVTFDIHAFATNTAPITAFRGAGRPEAAGLLERTIDVLAAQIGLDPVEIRRRNLVGRDQFPYQSPMGTVYDTGEYERCLDLAIERSDYAGLRAEQERRRAAGDRRLLGIGVACYVELSAGAPGMGDEYGSVEIDEEGRVHVLVGTSAHGQGHATVFAQIVTSVLGVPFDRVSVVDSDTDRIPSGKGTAGSRSVQMAGSAVKVACDAVLDRARQLAATELEASPDDLEIVPGEGIGVRGVPISVVPWARLAALAKDPEHGGAEGGLRAAPGFDQEGGTAPFGCHVAVVEVDADTGSVELVRMVAVDDCGTVINPQLADGQVHGGVFAGIAQALFEEICYDPDGNPLTASLAEYEMPSSADLPSIETDRTVTPTPKNPLGAKGLGEAGTCGALAAVHNAVVDAVAHLGVRHIDIPLTPERMWEVLSQRA